MTPFEELCLCNETPSHLISTIYRLLDPLKDSNTSCQLRWERELNRSQKMNSITFFLLTHKSSISAKAQKLNFKILSRWYRVPSLIDSIYPEVSDCCWRCGEDDWTMTHIWWGMSIYPNFWSKVIEFKKSYYRDWDQEWAGFSPSVPDPNPNIALRESLILFPLIAAKRQLSLDLGDPRQFPLWQNGLRKYSNLQRVEELRADLTRRTDKYLKVW